MTVIAWDGKVLAADRRANLGTMIRTVRKIFSIRGYLVGCTGDMDHCQSMLAWFANGAKVEEFPPRPPGDEWASLMAVDRDGGIFKYERTPHPVIFPPQQFAIGCGRDFAMTAMHLGKNAREAVEIACELDSGCGNGVDVLTHGTTFGPEPWSDPFSTGAAFAGAAKRNA